MSSDNTDGTYATAIKDNQEENVAVWDCTDANAPPVSLGEFGGRVFVTNDNLFVSEDDGDGGEMELRQVDENDKALLTCTSKKTKMKDVRCHLLRTPEIGGISDSLEDAISAADEDDTVCVWRQNNVCKKNNANKTAHQQPELAAREEDSLGLCGVCV